MGRWVASARLLLWGGALLALLLAGCQARGLAGREGAGRPRLSFQERTQS